jgi:hypothetical protein
MIDRLLDCKSALCKFPACAYLDWVLHGCDDVRHRTGSRSSGLDA